MSVLGVSSSEQRCSPVEEMPVFTPVLVLLFNHKKYIACNTQGDQIDKIQRSRDAARKKKDFVCSYIYKARLRMSLGIGHCPSGEVFPEL